MPSYCRLKCKGHGFTNLYYSNRQDLWVCGNCLLPSKSWFNKYLKRCFTCGAKFSSPVTEQIDCRNCSDSFTGWKELRNKEVLDKANRLLHHQGSTNEQRTDKS